MRRAFSLSIVTLVTLTLAAGCKPLKKTSGVKGLDAPSTEVDAPSSPGSSVPASFAPPDEPKPAAQTKATAYVFKVRLDLDQLFAQLNAAGPWTWAKRDSE